ncbi:MAG: DUF3256 family protein [Bacteroidaceae bacterium]|nr:DUF3256 family protein [Bacteroidaceae bacterium]
MKRLVFFLFLAVSFSVLRAQTRMRDIFASSPDSVFPMLTRNNRLDCIDFIENKMPARVKNRLDDVVELLSLTDSYLCLRTSQRSQVEMRLLSDSLFCLVNTYEGPAPDSHIRFFNLKWQPVAVDLPKLCVKDFWAKSGQRGLAESQSASSLGDGSALSEGGIPDSLVQEADFVIRSLSDLMLVRIAPSPEEPVIIFSLQTSELTEKERELAQRFVQPLKFRWNGEAFVRQAE